MLRFTQVIKSPYNNDIVPTSPSNTLNIKLANQNKIKLQHHIENGSLTFWKSVVLSASAIWFITSGSCWWWLAKAEINTLNPSIYDSKDLSPCINIQILPLVSIHFLKYWLEELLNWSVIWLVLWVDKMNPILLCDWLPEWLKWSYLVCPGLPHVSYKKTFPKPHITNP